MRVVVYTATFTDYDWIVSPGAKAAGTDYVLISDRKPWLVPGWSWRPYPAETAGLDQTMANRYCKFFPHKLFPDHDLSVYIDGSIVLVGDITPLLNRFVGSGADIGLFPHRFGRTLADEVEFAISVGKIRGEDIDRARAQLQRYTCEGLDPQLKISENAVLLRRHGRPALDKAMDLWWQELQAGCRRDQVSLQYCLWRSGATATGFDFLYRRDNPYFYQQGHRRKDRPVADIRRLAKALAHRPGYLRLAWAGLYRALSRLPDSW